MYEPVDPASELLATSTGGGIRNIILVALDMVGPFDFQIWCEAVDRTASRRPQLRSLLREISAGGRFYLVREHVPDLKVRCEYADLSEAVESSGMWEATIAHLIPIMNEGWDLFRRAPVEVHALRVGDHHHVTALLTHHAAGDGAMVSEIVGDITGYYHEMVTGSQPEWADSPYAVSAYRKRKARPRKTKFKEWLFHLMREGLDLVDLPTVPVGNGDPRDQGEHHVKQALSEEETSSLIAAASHAGVHLIDRLVASTHLALSQWNIQRRARAGTISSAVTVNLKGRFDEANSLNNTSVIFLRSSPKDRQDPTRLVRSLTIGRIGQFRQMKDVMLYTRARRFLACLRFFPLTWRSAIARFMVERHRYSLAVNFLGVIWPDPKDGRASIDSSIRYIGHTECMDVLGSNYKAAGNAAVSFYVLIYRKRLSIVLTSPVSVLSPSECDEFLDLVIRNLLDASA